MMNDIRMENNRQHCDTLLQQLRALDFAIQETVLYLDAYPDCQEALSYYHKLIDKRRPLMQRISEHCGPQTMLDNESPDEWQWVKTPWPWENRDC